MKVGYAGIQLAVRGVWREGTRSLIRAERVGRRRLMRLGLAATGGLALTSTYAKPQIASVGIQAAHALSMVPTRPPDPPTLPPATNTVAPATPTNTAVSPSPTNTATPSRTPNASKTPTKTKTPECDRLTYDEVHTAVSLVSALMHRRPATFSPPRRQQSQIRCAPAPLRALIGRVAAVSAGASGPDCRSVHG